MTAGPRGARVSAGRRRAPVCPTPARSAWGRGASSWLSLGPEARTPGAEAPKSNRVSAVDHRASGRPPLSTRFYLDWLLQFRCHCKLPAASTSPVSQKCRSRPQWEHTSHGPFRLGSWHLVDTVGDMSSRPERRKVGSKDAGARQAGLQLAFRRPRGGASHTLWNVGRLQCLHFSSLSQGSRSPPLPVPPLQDGAHTWRW